MMASMGYQTREQRARDHEIMQVLAFGVDAHEVARSDFLTLIYDADDGEGHARSCRLCHEPIRKDWPEDECVWCIGDIEALNEIDYRYDDVQP